MFSGEKAAEAFDDVGFWWIRILRTRDKAVIRLRAFLSSIFPVCQ